MEREGRREAPGPFSRYTTRNPVTFTNFFIKGKLLVESFTNTVLIDINIADAALIAKWKKSGYENLCCLRCVQPRDTNFGTTCICRVPKSKLETNKITDVCTVGVKAAPANIASIPYKVNNEDCIIINFLDYAS